MVATWRLVTGFHSRTVPSRPEVASSFMSLRACTVLASIVGAVLSWLTSVPP